MSLEIPPKNIKIPEDDNMRWSREKKNISQVIKSLRLGKQVLLDERKYKTIAAVTQKSRGKESLGGSVG